MSRELMLRNTRLVLQPSQAGVVARVERVDEYDHEYAGPLDADTLDSLSEVAE